MLPPPLPPHHPQTASRTPPHSLARERSPCSTSPPHHAAGCSQEETETTAQQQWLPPETGSAAGTQLGTWSRQGTQPRGRSNNPYLHAVWRAHIHAVHLALHLHIPLRALLLLHLLEVVPVGPAAQALHPGLRVARMSALSVILFWNQVPDRVARPPRPRGGAGRHCRPGWWGLLQLSQHRCMWQHAWGRTAAAARP